MLAVGWTRKRLIEICESSQAQIDGLHAGHATLQTWTRIHRNFVVSKHGPTKHWQVVRPLDSLTKQGKKWPVDKALKTESQKFRWPMVAFFLGLDTSRTPPNLRTVKSWSSWRKEKTININQGYFDDDHDNKNHVTRTKLRLCTWYWKSWGFLLSMLVKRGDGRKPATWTYLGLRGQNGVLAYI